MQTEQLSTITVRMKPPLREWLAQQAKEAHRSQSSQVIVMLEQIRSSTKQGSDAERQGDKS